MYWQVQLLMKLFGWKNRECWFKRIQFLKDYIISSERIFVVGILNLCENLSFFLFHRLHRNQIKKSNQIFIKERQFFPYLYLIIDSSHFKFIHLPLILATLIWIWMISLGTAMQVQSKLMHQHCASKSTHNVVYS